MNGTMGTPLLAYCRDSERDKREGGSYIEACLQETLSVVTVVPRTPCDSDESNLSQKRMVMGTHTYSRTCLRLARLYSQPYLLVVVC